MICFALSARDLLIKFLPDFLHRRRGISSNTSPDNLCYRWHQSATEHIDAFRLMHSDYNSTDFYFPERFIPEEAENREYEDCWCIHLKKYNRKSTTAKSGSIPCIRFESLDGHSLFLQRF
jgi:hypothetical protein